MKAVYYQKGYDLPRDLKYFSARISVPLDRSEDRKIELRRFPGKMVELHILDV